MSLKWKPQPINVYIDWIIDISDESGDKLNGWELNFVNSIMHRLDTGNNLTESQAEKLEKIYGKYTS